MKNNKNVSQPVEYYRNIEQAIAGEMNKSFAGIVKEILSNKFAVVCHAYTNGRYSEPEIVGLETQNGKQTISNFGRLSYLMSEVVERNLAPGNLVWRNYKFAYRECWIKNAGQKAVIDELAEANPIVEDFKSLSNGIFRWSVVCDYRKYNQKFRKLSRLLKVRYCD